MRLPWVLWLGGRRRHALFVLLDRPRIWGIDSDERAGYVCRRVRRKTPRERGVTILLGSTYSL